jgi:hypothetical protein
MIRVFSEQMECYFKVSKALYAKLLNGMLKNVKACLLGFNFGIFVVG